jgi:glutathione S-transferase
MHQLGLTCEYEAVDLKTKITESGAHYLEINPKGAVPALQLDNHEILTESAVILQYLADTHHAIELLPRLGDMKRYRALEWLNFAGTDLHRYCAPLFWSRFSDDIKLNVFTPVLKSKLTVVDDHLRDHDFLMGDKMTLGDSYLFVILIWLADLQFSMAAWPNLKRYFVAMKNIKAVQQALSEEGLSDLALI